MIAAHPVPGGLHPALRRRFELDDGRRAFLKAALDPDIALRLRRERVVCAHLEDSFMAGMLGWNEDPPMLLLEDLSWCTWVPPWTSRSDVGVRLPPTSPFAGIDVLGDAFALSGWPEVQRDSTPFLSLGLCSEESLAAALRTLVAALSPERTNGARSCTWTSGATICTSEMVGRRLRLGLGNSREP